MTRLQGFSLAMVSVALGVTAFIQIIPVTHVVQVISLAAFAVVSALAAVVFFICAIRGCD